MRILAGLLLCGVVQAQTLTLVGSPVRVGTQATISVVLGGVQPAPQLAGVQWSIAPPSGVALASSTGAASTGAGKTLTCGPTSPQICIVTGLNANVLANGVLATYSFTPTASGSLTFALSGLIGAPPDGIAVLAMTLGPPLTLAVLSPCDMNGDGKVDVVDLTALVTQAVGIAACTTADLDGDGHCSILDAQRLITAANGGACKTGQ